MFDKLENAAEEKECQNESTASVNTLGGMDVLYNEGFDREGPIRCICLCEFHPVAGPTIKYQFPEEFISKEIFDSISVYIIPKPQLQRCAITINALGHKVIGYPVKIQNSRYERNAYFFNLCFICDSLSQTVQYEPVIKKLAEHLTILEEEKQFLSKGSTKLPTLLAHLMHDLNQYRKATIVEGDTVIHVKVLDIRRDPPSVNDHDVPVFISSVGVPAPLIYNSPLNEVPSGGPRKPVIETPDLFSLTSGVMDADWDLTTQQLIPYIDGFNHIAKIAVESSINSSIVKTCVQNLIYYDVVRLLPILKYGNMYRVTPSLNRLFNDTELQTACLTYCTLKTNVKPTNVDDNEDNEERETKLSDVLSILCALQQGTTLRAICTRNPQPHTLGVDVRRLIVFAVMHGLIKCLKSYPVHLKYKSPQNIPPGIKRLFNGLMCIDEICCIGRVELPTLEAIIDDDPDIVVIRK